MNNKLIFSLAAALLLFFASCDRQDKTVEYPLIELANTQTLDIAKVELTDSVTTLHVNAYFTPIIGSESTPNPTSRQTGKNML